MPCLPSRSPASDSDSGVRISQPLGLSHPISPLFCFPPLRSALWHLCFLPSNIQLVFCYPASTKLQSPCLALLSSLAPSRRLLLARAHCSIVLRMRLALRSCQSM